MDNYSIPGAAKELEAIIRSDYILGSLENIKPELIKALTLAMEEGADNERTLPELPEGWSLNYLNQYSARFSNDDDEWEACVEHDNRKALPSEKGSGATPRSAIIDAIAKINGAKRG